MKPNLVVFCLDPKLGDEVGKLVASQLDMFYLNTTELFKFDHIPHTMEEFLENGGERKFRTMECGTISYASSFFNTAIFVDSGVVKSAKNISKLQNTCYFLYVKLAPAFARKKLCGAVYDNKTIKKFYCVTERQLCVRAEKMKQIADITVNGTRKSALKVSADLIRAMQNSLA